MAEHRRSWPRLQDEGRVQVYGYSPALREWVRAIVTEDGFLLNAFVDAEAREAIRGRRGVTSLTNIEHWPDVEQLRIDLIETQTDYGREVAPGVILHYARRPGGDILVSIEIERRPERDLRNVSFEQRNDKGNVVFQT